jgi:hypothetical protein
MAFIEKDPTFEFREKHKSCCFVSPFNIKNFKYRWLFCCSLVNWNLISGIPSNFLDIYQIPLDEIRRSLPKFDRHLKLLFNFFFFFFYVKASSFILSLRIALSLPEGWCEP